MPLGRIRVVILLGTSLSFYNLKIVSNLYYLRVYKDKVRIDSINLTFPRNGLPSSTVLPYKGYSLALLAPPPLIK